MSFDLGSLAAMAVLKKKRTITCDRCGMKYAFDMPECEHCKDIKTESELQRFKQDVENEHKASANLGLIFVGAAVFIGLLLLLAL